MKHNLTTTKPLPIAVTSIWLKLSQVFDLERQRPNGIRALWAESSMGKSTAIETYCTQNEGVYYVRCDKTLQMKDLLKELIKAMGKRPSGTIRDMLYSMVYYLQDFDKPMIIFDEVDKLEDAVFASFVDLENRLHQKCGIIFTSTAYLLKRMERGVDHKKMGFEELWSRMRKTVHSVSPDKQEFVQDAETICRFFGVNDQTLIYQFTNSCKRDFRVLTDKLNAYRLQQSAA